MSRAAGGPPALAPASAGDIVLYDFEPLLQAVGDECRRIVVGAHMEADRLRTEAQEEAHRVLADARREQCSILERAAEQQATLYREVQLEIDRRLRDAEEHRDQILRSVTITQAPPPVVGNGAEPAHDAFWSHGRDPAADPALAQLLDDVHHTPPSHGQAPETAGLEDLLAEVAGVATSGTREHGEARAARPDDLPDGHLPNPEGGERSRWRARPWRR